MSQTLDLLLQLQQYMKHHDWYFEYSDDHSVWLRGNAQRKDIEYLTKMLKTNGAETEAIALWDQYCPWSETNKGNP